MRRRSSSNLQPAFSNLQPALGTILEYEEPQHPASTIESPKTPTVTFGEAYMQEYPPSSPAESPKSQISSVSSFESPTSPLSPSSQEVEKRLEDAKQNAEENARNKEIIDRLGLEIGTKTTENAIHSTRLGELSGGVLKSPLQSSLLQRRSQSK